MWYSMTGAGAESSAAEALAEARRQWGAGAFVDAGWVYRVGVRNGDTLVTKGVGDSWPAAFADAERLDDDRASTAPAPRRRGLRLVAWIARASDRARRRLRAELLAQ
jgi:hypothetical protein